MKLLIVFCVIVSASIAQANDVLLTCTDTNFSDLKTIVITTSDVSANEMIVTETSSSGSEIVYSRALAHKENLDIELSDWRGYSRSLYNDGSTWSIGYHDECSGGTSSVTCF